MLVTQTYTSPRTHDHHLHSADMTFDLRDVLERSRGESLSRLRRPAEACRAGRLWVMRETRGIVAHLEWPAHLSLVTKCKSQLGGYNLHSGRKSKHGRASNTLALLTPPSLPPSKLLRLSLYPIGKEESKQMLLNNSLVFAISYMKEGWRRLGWEGVRLRCPSAQWPLWGSVSIQTHVSTTTTTKQTPPQPP